MVPLVCAVGTVDFCVAYGMKRWRCAVRLAATCAAIAATGCQSKQAGNAGGANLSRPSITINGDEREPGRAAAMGPVLKQPAPPAGPPRVTFDGRDPMPEVKIVVRLQVYRLVVPIKTVSRSEAFWKHVDENALGITEGDLLKKNGFRVGLAAAEDWAYFAGIFSESSLAGQVTGSSGVAPTAVELGMKTGLWSQRIMYLHPEDGVIGNDYERCDNVISIMFSAHPRELGTVTLALTPTVRCEREELRYTVLNDERYVRFVKPEHLYDLKLRADVPLNHFLIVAPSEDARDTTSLGHQFLIQDMPGEQYENVLILSPQPFIFGVKSTTAPATQPAPSPDSR